MSNRPQQLTLPPLRTYSRTEFTALRARVKGLPIARLPLDADRTEPLDAECLLRTMRDNLVTRAAGRFGGHPRKRAGIDSETSRPAPDDPVRAED